MSLLWCSNPRLEKIVDQNHPITTSTTGHGQGQTEFDTTIDWNIAGTLEQSATSSSSFAPGSVQEPEPEPERAEPESGLIKIFNRGRWVFVEKSHLDTIVEGLDYDEQMEYMELEI